MENKQYFGSIVSQKFFCKNNALFYIIMINYHFKMIKISTVSPLRCSYLNSANYIVKTIAKSAN